MAVFIVLLGAGGLVFGLLSLARPVGWLGVSTRRRAGWVAAASLGALVLGGLLLPPTTPSGTPEAAAPSTTSIDTSPYAPTATELPTTSSTTMPGPLPDVPNADIIFAPPSAGASGDPSATLEPGPVLVDVVSITDGDTLVVRFADGTIASVRLIGINTPESDECWAEEAGLALRYLTPPGSRIGVNVDVSDRDQFDRLLRYLWVGAMSVNEEMVRRGAAISRRYPPDTAMASRFEAAQLEAQSSSLGLWAPDACGPVAEADLAVVDLVYDPAGDDNQNLNGELIRVQNLGDNLVDMSGWGVKDESASHRYSFPKGFSLGPGETATIHSGCGDDFGTELFWCSVGSAIWNNDGDTAFLTDPSGSVHAVQSYASASAANAVAPASSPSA